MRIRAVTLVAIVNSVAIATYISSYQHVYSQSSPAALLLGTSDAFVTQILSEQGYAVDNELSLPADLSGYDVIIVTGTLDLTSGFLNLRSYVDTGGGYVYLTSAAESSDLAANYEWLGARSVGFTGSGESATASVENPLGTGLQVGDLLMQQALDESGAIWVNDLQTGAVELAEYSSGNVFAYTYEFGEGKVYFQGATNYGLAPQGNVEELLKAGIVWATSETDADPPIDFLPEGTDVTTGSEAPRDSVEVLFSGFGPQSFEFSDPVGMTQSIFVTATSEVLGATLFFDSDGEHYSYNVQPDSNTLLTFPAELNVTDVRVSILSSVDSDSGIEPTATVGFVTVRQPPACMLPIGSDVAGASSIPGNSMQVGSPGTAEGSSLDIPGPVVPITSLFVGYQESEANGFAVAFRSSGIDYICPISPSMVEISFDQPTAISDIEIRNVGPWGVVGYSEPFDGQAYVRYNISKAIRLPGGFQLQTNVTSPGQTNSMVFSSGEPALEQL
ncbi:MAG TPA: hypothetical protein VLA68_00530, partial [Nitrososphaera sp.]|nr:hypothetical protein [Nitrososphaera sp.]